MALKITVDDIKAAASRIEDVAVKTQLIENQTLNALTGGRVLIKPECLQRTGSFKIRGAYNRISQLSAMEKTKGVVAFSSGNHAQGVACAAQLLGVKATIVMPSDAPAIKVVNTRGYGAEVVLYDRFKESRENIARDIAEKTGSIVVPSFDDKDIIAGQGTVGLEIAEACKAAAIKPFGVVYNCGGGGLSSGSAIAMRSFFPESKTVIVEPEGFDDAGRSLKSGKIESNDDTTRSICDALLSPHIGEITFPILKDHQATAIAISDEEAKQAIIFAARELKIILEPGGAASLAGVLSGKIDVKGKTMVVVCSGGNVDPEFLAEILRGKP